MNDQSSRTRCSKSMHLHSVRARLLKSLTNATTGGPTRLFSSRRVRASLIQIRGFPCCHLSPSGWILFVPPVGGKIIPQKPRRESASGSTGRYVRFSCALCSIFGIAVAVMIVIVARAGSSHR